MFNIQIKKILEPSACNGCCVQPDCGRALAQVSLRINWFGNLEPGDYNNGCFKLSYSTLKLAMQMQKEEAGITNLNAALTDGCPGPALTGNTNGANFSLKSNEDTDITTLELGGTFLDQPGETPPEIIFNDWETAILFTMVIDFFPGEATYNDMVTPVSFLYVDTQSPQQSCTKFIRSSFPSIPVIYPEASNSSSDISLNLGTPDCSDQMTSFPLRISSAGVNANFLDFKIRINTNSTAVGTDPIVNFLPVAGMPAPTGYSLTQLTGTTDYVLYVYYENVSFPAASTTLLTVNIAPQTFGCYDFDLSLQRGKLVTGSGCFAPAASDITAECTGQCLAECGTFNRFVLQPSVPFGAGLCAAEYTVILSMNEQLFDYEFDRIQFQLDFDLDPDVSITSANFLIGTYSALVVGNSVIFNTTNMVWDDNLFLSMTFNGTTGCVNNAVFREFKVIPAGGNEYCTVNPAVESFPICMRKANGIIATEGGCRVNGVTVKFTPTMADPGLCAFIPSSTLSDCDGYEACLCPFAGEEWIVIPEKNDDLYEIGNLNFITQEPDILNSADLLVIEQHILGITPLGSPYRIIAADANNDGLVTTLDNVELRKLFLEKYSETGTQWPAANAPSWRFIPADYVFPAPLFPFAPFPPSGIVTNLSAGNLDFVAIKTGSMLHMEQNPTAIEDCNGSYPCNEQLRPVQQNFNVKTEISRVTDDGHIIVPVTAVSNAELVCWQMGLQFDPNLLELVDIQTGSLSGITKEDYNISRAAYGEVKIIWMAKLNDPADHVKPGDVLFNLVFKGKGEIPKGLQPVQFSNEVMTNKAWLMDFTPFDFVDINTIRSGERAVWEGNNGISVVCRPNPVTSTLTLDISIEKMEEAHIRILDLFGRVMADYHQTLAAGTQAFHIEGAANWPAGSYQWVVRTESGSVTQGIIIKQ